MCVCVCYLSDKEPRPMAPTNIPAMYRDCARFSM